MRVRREEVGGKQGLGVGGWGAIVDPPFLWVLSILLECVLCMLAVAINGDACLLIVVAEGAEGEWV